MNGLKPLKSKINIPLSIEDTVLLVEYGNDLDRIIGVPNYTIGTVINTRNEDEYLIKWNNGVTSYVTPSRDVYKKLS